ncbi:MAG: hypothetical protein SGBAC_010122 [Bacillariaceae sp.]
MDPLLETLLLNNEAVMLFHANGSLTRAADAYQKSLCNVRNLLRGNPWIEPTFQSTISSPEERWHSMGISSTISKPSSRKPLHDSFYLFQRALFLNDPSGASSNLQEIVKALPIFGSVVLFNTAILYHKNAALTGEYSSLDKAQRLYKASLQFATSKGATNPTDWLIVIAASNNLAQIAYEKGRIEEVNERLDDMSFVLSRGGSFEQLHGIFAVEEIQGFLSNAAMAGGFQSSPAA